MQWFAKLVNVFTKEHNTYIKCLNWKNKLFLGKNKMIFNLMAATQLKNGTGPCLQLKPPNMSYFLSNFPDQIPFSQSSLSVSFFYLQSSLKYNLCAVTWACTHTDFLRRNTNPKCYFQLFWRRRKAGAYWNLARGLGGLQRGHGCELCWHTFPWSSTETKTHQQPQPTTTGDKNREIAVFQFTTFLQFITSL